MSRPELTADEVRRSFDPSTLEIETTENAEPLQGIIGQSRAVTALEFGLGIQGAGFNIYVAGPPGTGKMTAVESFLERFAALKPAPPDYCYVTNFSDPYQPRYLTLPPGRGRRLAKDMKGLVERILRQVPRAFESDEYASRREAINQAFAGQRDETIEQLEQSASRAGFRLQISQTGVTTVLVAKGKPMTQSEFAALPESEQGEIERRRAALQQELAEGLKRIRGMERNAQHELDQLDAGIVSFVVGGLMEELLEAYHDLPDVVAFLNAVQRDLSENIGIFKPSGPDDGASGNAGSLPSPTGLEPELVFRKYLVNVLVDNFGRTGAPVVVEQNPTFGNLFGRIEKEPHFGSLYTDMTMIKSGAMQKANGGYLVLPVDELMTESFSWDALKVALRTGTIQIEEPAERAGQMSAKTLRPQAIPLDLKIVLVGSPSAYYYLFDGDESFPEFFKVKADFDTTMERNEANVHDLVAFVSTLCRKEDLKHLDRAAVARVLEHASRLAEDQDKLSTEFGALADVIREAHFWAMEEGAPTVSERHVEKALEEKARRSNLSQEHLRENILRGDLLIKTSGLVVGQINGLAVIARGDYRFGRPSRITASVGPGREGLIDIEREVQMGGPLHSKGILILSGYLRHKYAPDQPLTLSARVVFEQNYVGVEGDSASSAELYALLSALSGLPLKQGIAVTGSVNQHGEVQAIGGVNEKIEGFFDVCNARGLDGGQGVLIPESNARDLMLRRDVVSAVREGAFHVWAVETIDDGIEILSGVPAGEPDGDGKYPRNTVNECVGRRLAEFNRSWKEVVRSGVEC